MANKQKIPVTIILFLIWIGWSILSTLFMFSINKSFIGPLFLEGISFVIYLLILLTIYSLIFYGTMKRKIWSRKLALIFFPLSVGLSLVNLITYFINKDFIMGFFSQIKEMSQAVPIIPIESLIISGLLFGLLSQGIITILIIVLMIKKKDYFSR